MRDLDDPRITQIERTGYLHDIKVSLRCKDCKEPIYDDYIEDKITGVVYCEECFNARFKHRTA